MTSEPLGIGLLGYGTVGSSVDRLLRERADVVERVAGRPVRVVRALVRDAGRPRDGAAPGLLTDRFSDIRDDPTIKVVAEVMGGVEPTLGYLRELLERGVSVVSANKQLLARHGAELQQAADRGGAQLRYAASACAASPVVRVLQESLAAAGVDELIGIVNGTTNFMLTAMARDGRSYADALAEAQQLGYAEADPTEDVGGADAAAKLAILASLAFHRHLHIDDVPFEGIDTLHDDDVAFANELGYAVKLLVNLQWFVHAAAAAEALVIGTRSGIDLRTLHTALAAGPARSSFLENEALEVLEDGEYGERFPLGLVAKDLGMALELAHEAGIPAELSARTHDLYDRVLERYGAAAGEMAVVPHYEDLAGAPLRFGAPDGG